MVEFKRLWFLTVELELKGPHRWWDCLVDRRKGNIYLPNSGRDRAAPCFRCLDLDSTVRSQAFPGFQPLDQLTWFGGFLDVLGLGWVGLGWVLNCELCAALKVELERQCEFQ